MVLKVLMWGSFRKFSSQVCVVVVVVLLLLWVLINLFSFEVPWRLLGGQSLIIRGNGASCN